MLELGDRILKNNSDKHVKASLDGYDGWRDGNFQERDGNYFLNNQMEIIKPKFLISKIFFNSLDQINYRLDNTQERISEFNNKSIKIIQTDSQREKNIERKDENANDLWNNKKSKTKVIEIPERDERENWAERMFEEIWTKFFSSFIKNVNLQTQEAQQI